MKEEIRKRFEQQPIWRNFADDPSHWESIVTHYMHFFKEVSDRIKRLEDRHVFRECFEYNDFTVDSMYQGAKASIPSVLRFEHRERMHDGIDMIVQALKTVISTDFYRLTGRDSGTFLEYVDVVYQRYKEIPKEETQSLVTIEAISGKKLLSF